MTTISIIIHLIKRYSLLPFSRSVGSVFIGAMYRQCIFYVIRRKNYFLRNKNDSMAWNPLIHNYPSLFKVIHLENKCSAFPVFQPQESNFNTPQKKLAILISAPTPAPLSLFPCKRGFDKYQAR